MKDPTTIKEFISSFNINDLCTYFSSNTGYTLIAQKLIDMGLTEEDSINILQNITPALDNILIINVRNQFRDIKHGLI